MNWKEKLQEYHQPVDETRWEKIRQHAEVKRYNRLRLCRRIILYSIPVLVVLSTFVAIALLTPSSNLTNKKQLPQSQTPVVVVHDQPTNEETPLLKQPIATTTIVESTTTSSQQTTSTNNRTRTSTSNAPADNVSSQPHQIVPQTIESTTTYNTPPTTRAVSTEEQKITKTKSKSEESSISMSTPPLSVAENETSTGAHQEPINDYSLFIPNAFTPNGDGINDLFFVQANFEPSQFEIVICNRKGEVVFVSKDIALGWDGIRYGSTLPSDIYTYHIQYTDPEGKTQQRRGSLTLLK